MRRSKTSITKLNDLEFEKRKEISKRQASLAALTAATAAHLCKDGPSLLPGLQNGMKAMYANRRPAAYMSSAMPKLRRSVSV